MKNRSILVLLVFSILLGLSPLSADPTIRRGIDSFTTPADGKTYYDFSKMPVPAGFFCKGSKVFTGRVPLKGLPLTTQVPGQLKGADTIVERLDDAAFDALGNAETRLRFRALSLVSIAPIKTACGDFHAYVSLDGQQRVTTMKLERTQERGGTFAAPLAVNVKMTFIPVKSMKNKTARKLELKGSVNFPGHPIPWSFKEAPAMKSISSVMVDTNGDLAPDATLQITPNFLAGMAPDRMTSGMYGHCPSCCEPQTCHEADGEMHCTTTTDPYCPLTMNCC